MKHILYFIAISTWLCISATSCSNNEEKIATSIEPGVYYVGMDINTMLDVVTKNYDPSINNFTSTYDYKSIYLFNAEGESVSIPIVNDCPDGENTCTGIRYRIEVDNIGNATITPFDENGDPTSNSLKVEKDTKCYFSSYNQVQWKLKDSQIGTHSLGTQNFTFYTKDKDTNVEIYRSGTLNNANVVVQKNYTINELTSNGDLDLIRECSGFRVVAFFYDQENGWEGADQSLGNYKDWYVKIYLGGTAFPETYNFITNESSGKGGYYSTGDITSTEPYTTKFTQLRDFEFSLGGPQLEGYGYLSYDENHLYSPINEAGELHVYILVKRWTNNEKDPDEEWLSSDIGAIQTEAKATISDVGNNNHYTLGLTLSASDLVEAWKKVYPSTETSNNSTITRSPLGAEVRSFTVPENAIVCEIN